MPTPSTRTPVRIARGSYSNLNSSLSDLQDGEIIFAEDQDKLYIKEGSALVTLTLNPANPVFTGNATFDTNTLYVDGTNNRVGIGTTSPDSLLHLESAASPGVHFKDTTNNCSLNCYAQNSNAHIGTTSNHDLIIDCNSIALLTLTTGRHIVTQGLTGTSFNNDSGGAKILEVTGDGTVGEYGVINISGNQNTNNTGVGTLRFVNRENTSSSSAASANSKQLASIQSYISTSDTNAGDDCGGFLTFSVKAEAAGIAEKLRITSTGLGIGGCIPDCALEIQGATDPKLKLESQESGNKRLELWIDGGTAVGYIAANQSASSLQIQTSGNTAIEISQYQNVTFEKAVWQKIQAVSALELNLSTGNYFTKTISGNSTFTFVNPPPNTKACAFTLELTHSSGTVTWPSTVKWNADTAPTLTTGKTHLFMFVTDDGGARYRGSALVDYVN